MRRLSTCGLRRLLGAVVIGGVACTVALAGLFALRNSCSGQDTQAPATVYVDAGSANAAETGASEAPFKTVGQALQKVRPGGVIRIRGGVYKENLVLSNGVTLTGEGQTRPILQAANPQQPVAVLRGKAAVEFVRVTGGRDGLFVELDTEARIVDCEILDNREDGIGFQPSKAGRRPATVFIKGCLVSGNGDGIDLEGTRGIITGCRLIKNRDDGLDYDGDTECDAVENEIHDNRDDGIEIRLHRKTRARIERNQISGNGEDGIEIINTPVAGTTDNQVTIAANVIRNNARYGVGAVDQRVEDVVEGVVVLGITLENNTVQGNRRAEISGLARF